MVSKYSKIYITIGGVLMILSVFLFLISPPKVSDEFSGSASLSVSFNENVSLNEIKELVPEFIDVKQTDISTYTLTGRALTSGEYISVTELLSEKDGYELISYQSFSPEISSEILNKTIIAFLLGLILIIIYVSFAFRKFSIHLSSWKYGVASIIALIHDILIPIGIFSIISPFTNATIDTLFVTALLATIGYSINDTIVVFHRIRERLTANTKESFESIVDTGVKRSIRRAVNTSISTMIPLLLLFIFVPITDWFAIVLFIGILVGTYSSLFFAPSILLVWNKHFKEKINDDKEKNETELAEERIRAVLNEDTI